MRWQATFDRLDRISRERALTTAESVLLERCIDRIDSGQSERKGRPSAWSPEATARFADLIADGVSIRQAAVMCGRPQNSGITKFRQMKAQLGWQAC